MGGTKTISSLKDYHKWIEDTALVLNAPCIVLLSGELGCGKTEFVKYFCQLSGISYVTSPTFALHNSYQGENIKVDHFDLFRLQNQEEVDGSGFWDQIQQMGKKCIVFIEWPERIDVMDLPFSMDRYIIKINKVDSRQRSVYIKKL